MRYYVLALWELKQKCDFADLEQAKRAALEAKGECVVVQPCGFTSTPQPVWHDKDPSTEDK